MLSWLLGLDLLDSADEHKADAVDLTKIVVNSQPRSRLTGLARVRIGVGGLRVQTYEGTSSDIYYMFRE